MESKCRKCNKLCKRFKNQEEVIRFREELVAYHKNRFSYLLTINIPKETLQVICKNIKETEKELVESRNILEYISERYINHKNSPKCVE